MINLKQTMKIALLVAGISVGAGGIVSNVGCGPACDINPGKTRLADDGNWYDFCGNFIINDQDWRKEQLEHRKYLASIGRPVVGTPEYYDKLREDKEKVERERRYDEVMAGLREDARQRNKEFFDKVYRPLFWGLGTDIAGYEYKRKREKE